MQSDFWNNPLVVSAIRLKYRRSSPALLISVYLLSLLGLAFAIDMYSQSPTVAPGLIFLLIMLGLQFLLSGAIALYTVSSSMNAEVANRTLDFQRIVSLSPREILVGKMLGEPTIGYFLLISTVPFAIFSYLLGSTTLWTIFWFYINLLSFTLACASLGLLHSLKLSKKSSGAQGNIGGAIIFPLFMAPMFLANTARVEPDTWMGALVNLATPIGALMGLFGSEPWSAYVPFWGYKIPSLYIVPATHALIVASVLAAMSRRLHNSISPLVTRVGAYVALLVFDCTMAAILYSFWLSGDSAFALLFTYGLGHVIFCLLLMIFSTPSQAALKSWLWRYETSGSWLINLWTDNRAMINGSLAIFCLIGTLVLLLGFVVPINLSSPTTLLPSKVFEVLSVSTLIILALGTSYQWCLATGGSSGIMVFALLLLIACIVGPVTAAIFSDIISETSKVFLQSTSPLMYFLIPMNGSSLNRELSPGVLIAGCGILWLVLYFSLKRWLQRQRASISKKLTRMGIT